MSYLYRVPTKTLNLSVELDSVTLRWAWRIYADDSETKGLCDTEAEALLIGLRCAHLMAASLAEKWDEHVRKISELVTESAK